MNEFKEKLIHKLEVRREYHKSQYEPERANECKEVIRIINELAEEYNGGWIPCSERLPENMQTVIFSTEEGMVESGWYDADKNWCVNDSYFPNAFRFVAWQPLPDPYIEEKC